MRRIPVPPTWVAVIVAALIVVGLVILGNGLSREGDWRFRGDSTGIEQTL